MRFSEIILIPIFQRLVEDTNNESCWSEALSAKDILAEIGFAAAPAQSQQRETIFRRCNSYKQTYLQKVKPYPSIRRKFADFMELKRWNPIQPFGKSDKLFLNYGYYIRAIPNLKHAHITLDLSIVYKLEGGVIWLYGFYTHNELGTGQPPNKHTADAMATKFKNKSEADCPIGVKRPQPRYR